MEIKLVGHLEKVKKTDLFCGELAIKSKEKKKQAIIVLFLHGL